MVAGVVAIVSDQDALGAVLLERGQVIVGETLHAVACRDVAIARAPERHGIDQRLAQDDFLRGSERFDVPHAAVRSRQIQVQGRARSQIRCDLAAVDLQHVAGFIEYRNHQRAVEVLAPGGAVQPQLREPAADRLAVLAVLLRQSKTERAIGVAEFEALDQFGMCKPAGLEIGLRLGALLEGLMVVVDDLVEQRLVVGVERHRRGQLRCRGLAHGLVGC